MKNALYGAAALALLGIAAFFGTLAWVASKVPRKIDATRADLNAQAEFARAEIARQIEAARVEILALTERQLDATRGQVLEIVDRRTGDGLHLVDTRIGDSLSRVDTALAKVDGIVTIAGDLRDKLSPTLLHLESLTGQVDAQAPLFLNCEYNPDCVMNRYQGASKAFERAMQHTAAAMAFAPKISEQVTGIATDFHTFTSKFTGPRTKKQKLWDGIKTSAFIGVRLIP